MFDYGSAQSGGWGGWREHRIGRRDIAGAWAVSVLFLAALLARSL